MKEISLRRKRWGYVVLLTLVIYATLYIARPVCTFLRSNILSFDIIGNISLAVIAAVTLSITFKNRRRGLIKRDFTFILLVGVIFIYTVIIWRVKLAEEKIHFFEYGLLGFLIYRAFLVDVKGWRAYVFALMLGFVLGWIDEIIQYILPNRYYEFKDVLMNGAGVLMGLVFTFIINMDKQPLSLTADPQGQSLS